MRALAFTVTSLALGISAHLLAGGAAPSTGVTLFLALLVLVCAHASADGEKGLLFLGCSTASVQLGVHLALMSRGGGSMAMTGHAMGMTPGMLAAHAVAATAVCLLLRYAEAGFWLARRWLGVVLPVPEFTVAGWPPMVGAPVPAPPSFPGAGLLLASARRRRGPPLAG